MGTLLFGVILGLLAVVYSAPVDTMTQIATKAEDEVVREALTDGFLVDHNFLFSLTTESPKRNTTAQASQQPSDSREGDMIEGSDDAGETSSESTTLPRDTDDSGSDSSTPQTPQSGFTTSSVPNEAESSVTPDHISVSQTADFLSYDLGSGDGERFHDLTTSSSMTSSSTSTLLPRDTDDSGSDSPATQSPPSGFTSSSVPNEAQSSVTLDHILVSQTADFLGSGDGWVFRDSTTSSSMTSSSDTETSTAPSTSTAALARDKFAGVEASGSGSGFGSGSGSEMLESSESKTIETAIKIKQKIFENVNKPQGVLDTANPALPHNKGHSTPGWIIIVGFIVGLAALVILCVAIATRDRWNGRNHASQLQTKTNNTNQQREVEMETFLHKDQPRENGKAAEYTVIPLDELPEKYPSH